MPALGAGRVHVTLRHRIAKQLLSLAGRCLISEFCIKNIAYNGAKIIITNCTPDTPNTLLILSWPLSPCVASHFFHSVYYTTIKTIHHSIIFIRGTYVCRSKWEAKSPQQSIVNLYEIQSVRCILLVYRNFVFLSVSSAILCPLLFFVDFPASYKPQHDDKYLEALRVQFCYYCTLTWGMQFL